MLAFPKPIRVEGDVLVGVGVGDVVAVVVGRAVGGTIGRAVPVSDGVVVGTGEVVDRGAGVVVIVTEPDTEGDRDHTPQVATRV